MVCRAENKFNIEISNIKRITQQVKQLSNYENKQENNREIRELSSQLMYDKKYIHYMCGTCYKINETVLINLERQLDKLLIDFAIHYTVNKKGELQQILRILSGHYPLKYRSLENYCIKQERKNHNTRI